MEFAPQINKFQTLGIYDYKLDEVGNVIANSSSVEFSYNYLGLSLLDVVYNTQSITSYSDVDFIEFIPSNTGSFSDVRNDLSNIIVQENIELEKENVELRSQLDNLIFISENNSSAARDEAMKQVIIDLRIKIGQGKEERDFNVDFPYTARIIE